MFPTNEMVLSAEVAYRREQLMATRTRPRFGVTRRFWPAKVRNAPKRGQYVTAA